MAKTQQGLNYIQLGYTPALTHTMISPAQTYNGELMTPFSFTAKVTCTLANAVYDIGNPITAIGGTGILDGTNLVTVTEMTICLNDFTQPTGTNASTMVSIFRTDEVDGTLTSALTPPDSTITGKEAMIAQSVVHDPYINKWSTKKIKLASSTAAATFNITVKGVFYTPGS